MIKLKIHTRYSSDKDDFIIVEIPWLEWYEWEMMDWKEQDEVAREEFLKRADWCYSEVKE